MITQHPYLALLMCIAAVVVALMLYIAYLKLKLRFYQWSNKRRQADIARMNAEICWRIVNELRDEGQCTGSSVTLLCDNDDPPPGAAIECNGEWTNWQDRRFEGDNILAALKDARTVYQSWKLTRK